MRMLLTKDQPDAFLLLCVSRLGNEKSLPSLIPLLGIPGLVLALVGDGDQRPYWAARREPNFFLSPTYFFHDELSAAYASCDAFIIPSSFETLGNVVLEAMASGTAVLGRNAGGIPHMIQHEETGLLFDDDTDMYRQVVRMKTDSALRQRCAQSGLAYARAQSWTNATQVVYEHYEATLAGRQYTRKLTQTP